MSCAADELDLGVFFSPTGDGSLKLWPFSLSLLEVSVSKLPHGFLPVHLFMCVSGLRGCGGGGGSGG